MTLHKLLASLACAAAASLTCAAEPATFTLPNSADAPCHVEGTSLRIDLDSAPQEPVLTFPRLNNVVLEVSWAPRGAAPQAPAQALSLTQTPQIWAVHLTDAVAYPAIITLRCGTPPLYAPEGHVCLAAADGTLTLPARHALVRGEKLQFEPLPHKNTVGYWVNPDDAAAWRFATDTSQAWDVHVLQGCGGGQGGSQVRFAVGDQAIDYTVVDTGHFQNFRWHRVGTLDLPMGEHRLEVSCVAKARNAVVDIRQIRLAPQGSPPPDPSLEQTQSPRVR